MTGIWLIGFIVLWVLVIVLCLVILSLAQEVEAMHKKIDQLARFFGNSNHNGNRIEKETITSLVKEDQ